KTEKTGDSQSQSFLAGNNGKVMKFRVSRSKIKKQRNNAATKFSNKIQQQDHRSTKRNLLYYLYCLQILNVQYFYLTY
ncbi:MAG: hypothetical protein LBQ50_09030, partial [Planctomycetaceae bacterium]|nr:hypothetical protein [Planctomycetaceae bacterium]